MDRSDWQPIAYEYGPYAVMAVVFVFMLWVRLMPYDRVVTSSTVFFSGNDPWYHARMIQLIVEHFPATPDFDPWSQFPYGTGRHSGFGGLFDQLIALVVLIIGLGNPDPHLVDTITAVAPPVFGAITALTTYSIARYLTDRWSALLAVGLLALAGGQFLTRTIVGVSDHQSAEALFGSLAVLGFFFAITTVYAEKPLIADLQDRNWIVLRRPTIASITGGTAIAAYLMMWGPGVMLVFAMGVFVVLQLLRDYLNDTPLDYLMFGTVTTMGTAGVLTLLYAQSYIVEPTAFSLLQPLVLFGIIIGAVLMYALADYLDQHEYEQRYYPVITVALIAAGIALGALVYPRTIDLLRGLISRIYSFGILTSASGLTVAEIQPATLDDAWRAFGAVFYVALISAAIMIVRVVRENRPLELFVILWSYTIFSAYFTSIRFGYYLAVNVAVLAGFGIWWTNHHLLSIDVSLSNLENIRPYQVIGVLIILIAVVPGNVVAISNHQPVWKTADRLGGTNTAWNNELQWMQEGTPEVPLEYTARYQSPSDGDFDYPRGAYGVMSWWDYGHWITVKGHRIPVANPFQQGPRPASAYLQVQNETRANLMLEALPSMDDREKRIHKLSNKQLRSVVQSQTEQERHEDTRYVMIDDQMAAGKFGAIATWTGPGYSSYVSTQEVKLGDQTAQLPALNQRYQQTMLARLYFQDANGLSHYRLVHETQQQSTIVSVARKTQGGWRSTGFFNRILRPGIFNQVQRQPNLRFYDVRRASRVKTFERVEGAKLRGSIDVENQTTVFATLRLRTNTGRNFSYIRRVQTDRDGDFTMTVPYPTSNSVSPANGGTDSGVRAMGNYTLFAGSPLRPTHRAKTSVPESAIYGGDTIDVEFSTIDRQTGNQSQSTTSNDTNTSSITQGMTAASPGSTTSSQIAIQTGPRDDLGLVRASESTAG